MKELKISVLANSITEEDVDMLDKLLCKLFNTEDVLIMAYCDTED